MCDNHTGSGRQRCTAFARSLTRPVGHPLPRKMRESAHHFAFSRAFAREKVAEGRMREKRQDSQHQKTILDKEHKVCLYPRHFSPLGGSGVRRCIWAGSGAGLRMEETYLHSRVLPPCPPCTKPTRAPCGRRAAAPHRPSRAGAAADHAPGGVQKSCDVSAARRITAALNQAAPALSSAHAP